MEKKIEYTKINKFIICSYFGYLVSTRFVQAATHPMSLVNQIATFLCFAAMGLGTMMTTFGVVQMGTFGVFKKNERLKMDDNPEISIALKRIARMIFISLIVLSSGYFVHIVMSIKNKMQLISWISIVILGGGLVLTVLGIMEYIEISIKKDRKFYWDKLIAGLLCIAFGRFLTTPFILWVAHLCKVCGSILILFSIIYKKKTTNNNNVMQIKNLFFLGIIICILGYSLQYV